VVRRRLIVTGIALCAFSLPSNSFVAFAENALGVTDTEIKFGQTLPYSGPLSAYGVLGRSEAAYFKMINEMGGINGRKLNFISLDDGYSPPKTVEQTRRLVEEEHVAFIFGTLGGVTNVAIMPYLNENKIPQLFAAGGADMFTNFAKFPWSIGLNPANVTEAHLIVRRILATNPTAKIGMLYQNDLLGKNFLAGIHEALGAQHAGMMVKEVSFEVSEPTIDSQIVTLHGAGVDTLIIIATPKAASQAIRKTYDLAWNPERYLFSAAASIVATLKPAGLEKSKGVVSARYLKDQADPRWKDDPGFKEWSAFAEKYLNSTERADSVAAAGFDAAILMVQVLKQCGDDLSRENIMRQATNIKDFALPMMLPGATINTSKDNHYPMRQMQFARFNGESWELFGDLLGD
jgi:branched-chain amino acid transport system substrate-binding protein